MADQQQKKLWDEYISSSPENMNLSEEEIIEEVRAVRYEKIRVIIDTNLWISLLIGKRLSELYTLCNSAIIEVYICDEIKE